MRGKDTLHDLAEEWRFGGTDPDDDSPAIGARPSTSCCRCRRHRPAALQDAVRAFARAELGNHRYVMVLHTHQANPHVHLAVRAEGRDGRRLNPRKADLRRWRETFAEKLRERGIEAEATRQATRGATRNHPDLWRLKAAADGRLLTPRSEHRRGSTVVASRAEAQRAWQEIATALARSSGVADKQLAESIIRFAYAPGLNRVQASSAGRSQATELHMR
jgi:hypothetical protein